jgi:hypothetical protein
VRAVRSLIVLGVLLLAAGFAVGIEPRHLHGRACGTVLLVRPGAPAPDACTTRFGHAAWLGTWVPLAVGGLVLVVGTTAYRERGDRPSA